MRLTLHTNLRLVLLAAGTLTLAACPEKEQDTDSATGTGTESTTGTATESPTTGTSTTATTGETPTTGGTEGGTMTGTTADGTTETGATTTANATEGTTVGSTGGTTGEVVPPELDAACTSACEKFFECFPQPPFPDIETCAAECSGSLGEGEMCLDVTVEFNNCIGEMTCDQLMNALENEDFGPCAGQFEAMEMSCVSNVCEAFGSQGPPNSCSIGQSCPNMPTQEFSCEGDTCTCLVDDQPQGMCPAVQGFCDLPSDEQAAVAFECCGFEL